MPGPLSPFVDRLNRGLSRIDTHPPEGSDAEAKEPLRKSLQRTLARVASKGDPSASVFRFQLTSGKPILFQGKEALPLEPARLVPILNSLQVELQPGETIDLDGSLAAWLIRPDATLTESNLRIADSTLKGLKSGRDRDHAAAQAAESAKIRLRSRLTQLVTALQYAQKDAEAPLPFTPVPVSPLAAEALAAAPPAPPPAPLAAPTPAAPDPVAAVAELTPPPAPPVKDPAPNEAVFVQALRKTVSAIEGSGFKAIVLGDAAHRAWGSPQPVRRIEVLVNFEGPQRQAVLFAVSGAGLRPASDDEPLHLVYGDEAAGTLVPIHLVQAMTSFQKRLITRAQSVEVMHVQARVASCEDLILMRAASDHPGHAESVVELFRAAANKIDAAYIKKEAEAAGTFDQVRAAWKQAKNPA